MKSLLLFLFILTFSLFGQKELLNSGPMPGYSEIREVMIWVQTKSEATVHIVYYDSKNPDKRYFSEKKNTTKEKAFTAHLLADSVDEGITYNYELFINGTIIDFQYPLTFSTQKLWQWRTDPPNFTFAAGSCAYINETVYDRPGKPYGGQYEIFNSIADKNPDFMVWLGDNVYLREADWNTRTGIFHRYTHDRSLPELQKLLSSTHHYAIWDDHEYGQNNSDNTFRNKKDALEAFKLFWANNQYGHDDNPGIYSTFQWGDVDFFLLDNRYYRTPEFKLTGKKTILGEKQLNWLIDALASSKAPFKIICLGGQFLNTAIVHENYSTYGEEKEEILQLLHNNRIEGVFFISGDRHTAEAMKMNRKGAYPLYEVTTSPLTAGTSKAQNEPNGNRIPGTYFENRNFALFSVSGQRLDRTLLVKLLDTAGNEVWSLSLNENDLKYGK